MSKSTTANRLIIPVYINEKIILDMLAIIEDGFSMVSQVTSQEHKENGSTKKLEAGASTTDLLNKLLKINLSGEISHEGKKEEDKSSSTEKVHTNVSLLSKFRSYLLEEKILKQNSDIGAVQIGDFIEIEGELQKNPLINYMDILVDVFRLSEIFTEEAPVGKKTDAKKQKQQENKLVRQIQSFSAELKHSGTIDFILSGAQSTVVLSAQEQYLANDNISEIIGGRFKVLGKVIAICKEENDSINLLRKTTLSVFPENTLTEMFSGFSSDEAKVFNLPELVTEIAAPAMIVIPVAIYA